ncbi:hypothetical protein [Maricaulis maris]|uniref:hypothetical protein n=1 Tax=Maricaulis maris TaxID=74318 RepID=UPI003B8DC1A1
MFVALLASLVAGTGSPPPPPPGPPAAAQIDHDGYAGADLWQAWSDLVRARAVEERDAAYAAAADREGWRRTSDGPVTSSTTGYWTEAFEASFVQLCNTATQDCEWVYRSARLTARADDFHVLAEASFDGQAIARSLRGQGITPVDLSERPAITMPDLDALDTLLQATRSVQVAWEQDCPAVGRWRTRLSDQDPLLLGPEDGRLASMPPPPYPIHIRQVVEVPVEGYGGADVTVRIEGVRNRAVSDLWQVITEGIADCR